MFDKWCDENEIEHPCTNGQIERMCAGPSPRSRFSSLSQICETPAPIAAGSGAALLETAGALPRADTDFAGRIVAVLRRFAWVGGVSAWLSDAYRGGMIINFILSSLAILGGVLYLLFVGPHEKWAFAMFELVLLSAILLITSLGHKKRWHGHWFETRRVAEYLRHAPLLLTLGAARVPGRWPQGGGDELARVLRAARAARRGPSKSEGIACLSPWHFDYTSRWAYDESARLSFL